MSTVIRVENLSKQYRLGDVGTGTLSHDLKRWWYQVRGKEDPYLRIGETNDRSTKGGSDYVWALKDINFEVKAGEVLGIIGRNGAGKSTLLKILSKTTKPTTGSIKVKGRIASLLEVGTGFHPELTGRENIYLNGAILGMTRREIHSKFEEIVDFSGVERYIDTPVKRYSSGMYVRLAFAVAAHLEPEILIVDEVLAVGDAEFQKKCLGKMKDVSVNEGRTVLFVSHQLGLIQNLCSKCILLEKASIKKQGNTIDILNYYLNNNLSFGETYENLNGIITYISLFNQEGAQTNSFTTNESVAIKVRISESLVTSGSMDVGIAILDNNRNKIFTVKKRLKEIKNNSLICILPDNLLTPGIYSIDVALFKGKADIIEYCTDVLALKITDGGTDFSSFEGVDYGKVFVYPKWI